MEILETVSRFVWGGPVIVMVLGTGVWLSVRTGFAQLRLFPRALQSFLRRFRKGSPTDGVSPFQALCTALAATVGTGNLVGVAGAICLGGPGSIFWMWISALLGMATKYGEAALAVHYRTKGADGYTGGPMYVICRGLGDRWSWLASLYCFFGVIAAFGVGNATQVNAVVSGVGQVLSRFGRTPGFRENLAIGILAAMLVGIVLLGGAGRVGRIAELLVPIAAGAYIALCLGVLVLKAPQIPGAFRAIFLGAFSPGAVTGGIVGSFFQTLRTGVSRGVFTNEAGMGTAAIAHGAAEAEHPAEQGLMGIMEVFLDTILICTLTALVILCSGVPVGYGADGGGGLTVQAFCAVFGDWVSLLLAAAMCCFAFATILGWGYYGARCAQYLFGDTAWKWFALAQTGMVLAAAVMKTGVIWTFSEIVNGLMSVPNLIALCALCPVLARLTREYGKKRESATVFSEKP